MDGMHLFIFHFSQANKSESINNTVCSNTNCRWHEHTQKNVQHCFLCVSWMFHLVESIWLRLSVCWMNCDRGISIGNQPLGHLAYGKEEITLNKNKQTYFVKTKTNCGKKKFYSNKPHYYYYSPITQKFNWIILFILYIFIIQQRNGFWRFFSASIVFHVECAHIISESPFTNGCDFWLSFMKSKEKAEHFQRI